MRALVRAPCTSRPSTDVARLCGPGMSDLTSIAAGHRADVADRAAPDGDVALRPSSPSRRGATQSEPTPAALSALSRAASDCNEMNAVTIGTLSLQHTTLAASEQRQNQTHRPVTAE